MEDYRYRGFISYSHADEAIAARLHKALETYTIPKALLVNSQKTLSPIFRDAAELSAHHDLSEKIRDAVLRSEFLIVLCSPDAKTSHWVNEEVRLFRKLHGEASILCVLISGTPDTAFPPALTEGGREPLAAALGRTRESFRLGVTQIAASILGVELDELIQRDQRRRRRRSQALMLSAIAFSSVMGITAITALQARNEAQESRNQAEGLVEYMITDLKDKLEPVGRLDILEGIGQRAVEYYNAQDIDKLPTPSLARQARARLVLGQVALDEGQSETAKREIDAALVLTAKILKQNKQDPEATLAYAKSEYMLGSYFYRHSDYPAALSAVKRYDNLTTDLISKVPGNFNYLYEAGNAANSLANISRVMSDNAMALKYYDRAAENYNAALALNPKDKMTQFDLTDVYHGQALITLATGTATEARKIKETELETLKGLADAYPEDYDIKLDYIMSRLDYYRIFFVNSTEHAEKRQTVLEDFKNLVLYDPDNAYWRTHYALNLHRHLMSKSVLNRADVIEFKRLLSGDNEHPTNFDEIARAFYLSTLEAHFQLQAGNRKDAKALIVGLSMDFIDHEPRNGYEQNWDYILYNLNIEIENRHIQEKYATKFLNHSQVTAKEVYPTTLAKKARVFSGVKRCDAAQEIIINLSSRGFSVDDKLLTRECAPTD